MSATKDWIFDYDTALDEAWGALEEAICKMNALNDMLYDEAGEMRARCPRADVSLLSAKVKELQGQISTMDNAKEPQHLPPILPGELRFACS